jgi:hypothetical protein
MNPHAPDWELCGKQAVSAGDTLFNALSASSESVYVFRHRRTGERRKIVASSREEAERKLRQGR